MTDATTQDGQLDPLEPTMEDTIATTLREIQARVDAEEDDPVDAPPAIQAGDADFPLDPPQPQDDAVKPPSGWKKEALAKWGALDPELKSEINRREEDFHKGIDGYKQKAGFADEVTQSLQPYMATIQSLGATPQSAIREMFATDHILRYGNADQKLQMMQKLAQNYGVDLGTVQGYQQPFVDSQVQALQQQIGQLQSVLSQQQSQQAHAEQQGYQAQIEAFQADPAHEHFGVLRGEMAALLSAGIAQDLQDAYDRAMWARPDLRSTLLAQQQAQATQQRQAQVQQARKAAAVNTARSGKPASGPATPPANMDEDLRQQVARLKEQGYSF